MEKVRLTHEELIYLGQALDFYCDETTHDPKGEYTGLNPYSKEGKILNKIREKINSPTFSRRELKRRIKKLDIENENHK